MTHTSFSKILLLCLAVLGTAGCSGGRYPVVGKASYADGTPVDGGTVIAEAVIDGKPVSLQANIEADGTFKLGGATPGDGALPVTTRLSSCPWP